MERTPINSPLPCFSLEHSECERCIACDYADDCKRYMGKRSNVRLNCVKFNLSPDIGEVDPVRDPELSDLQQLYEQCYMTIFERPPTDRLDRRPNAEKVLEEACEQTGCTLRMFMLASMFGHRTTAPNRNFYANMLLGPYAIRRANLYRGACSKAFGTFDLQALEDIMKCEDRGLESRMLNSEIIAGQWIVGYKLRFPGPYGAPLYSSKELALDPYWLAIEKSYLNLVLVPNHGVRTDIPELNRHRFNVSKVHHNLKVDSRKKSKQLRAVFGIRERNAPEALRQVLNHFRFDPKDFTTTEPVVTDMLTFWGKLAIALKNHFVECLVDGDRSVLNYLRSS